MTDKPNIIYIFSDQHRGGALGSVNPALITPNLDILANEGINFTHCYTNSPLCMPARASMMTGKYVSEHGVWENRTEANPKGPSHVRNIKNAGYHTAIIGKTHLYRHGGRNATHTMDKKYILEDWGFMDICELTGPLATIRNDSPYTDYLKNKGLLETHRQFMTDYWQKWTRGQAKAWEEPPSPLPDEDHLDSFTGRTTVDWIKNYTGDKPFYLQVLFPGPHDPFDSPVKYRNMYKEENMPVGIIDYPQEPTPFYVKFVLNWGGLKGITPAQQQRLKTFYYGKITLIDEYIGYIIKALEEKGILDNTWIIYNSDHGEMAGDHMMRHKIVFYEDAIHIPLIIRPPKGIIHNSWKCKGLCEHIDITATLLDIAGAEPMNIWNGRTLLPQILEGPNSPKAQKGKEAIFSQVFGFSMIRTEKFKLAVSSKSRKPVELFDLEKDPRELKNIINDESYVPIINELMEKYLDKLLDRMDEEGFNEFKSRMIARIKRRPEKLISDSELENTW